MSNKKTIQTFEEIADKYDTDYFAAYFDYDKNKWVIEIYNDQDELKEKEVLE